MPFSRSGMGGRDYVMVAALQVMWLKTRRGRAGPRAKINSIICLLKDAVQRWSVPAGGEFVTSLGYFVLAGL